MLLLHILCLCVIFSVYAQVLLDPSCFLHPSKQHIAIAAAMMSAFQSYSRAVIDFWRCALFFVYFRKEVTHSCILLKQKRDWSLCLDRFFFWKSIFRWRILQQYFLWLQNLFHYYFSAHFIFCYLINNGYGCINQN